MTERIQVLRELAQMEEEDVEDMEDTEEEEEEEEEEELTTLQLDEILNASLLELDTDTDNIHIYSDENPYKIVEMGSEMNNNIYQVIGNEIILITRGDGYCCICSEHGPVLYCDNSYGNNISTQICKGCIDRVMITASSL